MINYAVRSTCLRYIVPFTYDVDKTDFDKMCSKVEAVESGIRILNNKIIKDWTRCTPKNFKGESDLYAYIREEFMFDSEKEKQPASKMGAQWRCKISDKTPLASLLFLRKYSLKEIISKENDINKQRETLFKGASEIDLKEMGLYIFRNGLGFVWFELCPKGSIESDLLMEMQGYVKELNRGHSVRLLRKSNKEPSEGYITCIDSKGKEMYFTPFFPGIMIADQLEELGITFLTERKSNYAGMIKTANNFIKEFPSEKKAAYTAGRMKKAEEHSKMPDKAVLFSYATLKNPDNPYDLGDEEDRYYLTYYLTNGYNTRYDCSPDMIAEMKRPFKDAYWFASKEGASYFKWPNQQNEKTFSEEIRNKVRGDYFVLFIKIIFQSYSLQLLGRKIQEDISTARIEDMSKDDYAKIERRYEETNLFLTKNMATSVSHIGHQSDFYAYLKARFRIAEDVQSITVGLGALDSLQKEKREEDEKKRDNASQRALEVISVLAIASALIDGYDFIATYVSGNQVGGWNWLRESHPVAYKFEFVYATLVIIFGIIVGFICFKNLFRRFREWNKERKE